MKEKIFFPKNASGPSNPPDELAQNVSKKKKNPFRTNYSSIFSSKVQNLTVFSIIYKIRIRFFGPGELFQKYFSAAQYFYYKNKWWLHFNKSGCDTLPLRKRSDFKQALSTLERLHQEAGEEPFVPTYSYKHKQWQSA